MNRLQLNTRITPEHLQQVEDELIQVIHACILKYRNRYVQSPLYKFASIVVKPIGMLGVAWSFVCLYIAGSNWRLISVAIACAAFFLLIVIFFWDRKKAEDRVLRFFHPFRWWLARYRASRMLKAAKKIAPFNAEYDFRGNSTVYYRTKDDVAKFAWVRKMKGSCLTRDGFTLIFKRDKSIYPYGIILHNSPAEVGAYLEAVGIKPYSLP